MCVRGDLRTVYVVLQLYSVHRMLRKQCLKFVNGFQSEIHKLR